MIGLHWGDEEGQEKTKEDVQVTRGILQVSLQKFETQFRGDEKYYNPNSSWMGASIVNRGELGALDPDHREWGEYAVGDDESDSEDDEADETEVAGDGPTPTPDAFIRKTEYDSGPGTGTKLRTAGDVMNRLRWDPHLDSADYLVGYLDRFTGVQEKLLDLWKMETESEEFIPQHRILYFKRRSDSQVVWDKRSRTDNIFVSRE